MGVLSRHPETTIMNLEKLLDYGGLDAYELVLRIGLAIAFGLAIGTDRELRNKPAGLRTHAMISLAACTFTILALALLGQVSASGMESGRADPLRALEAVATGVAFIGAGAIIQSRGDVQGITTGSGIWLAGAIGLACGGGYYFLAGVTTLFGIILLTVFGLLEKHLLDQRPDQGDTKPRAPKSG